MKKIKYTTIEDLINDESFINWAHNRQMADVNFWNNWIIENPAKKQLANDAKDIVVGIKFRATTVSSKKTDNAWAQLENTINAQNKALKLPFYKNRIYQSIAATVLLFIAVSSFYVTNRTTTILHKTAFGEILDIKLPDGTKVKLNSNSSLSYSKQDARNVILRGEAFFDVEKKPSTNAKFFVATEDLIVEVFGTSFNVNNRDALTQVFLEEGLIALKLNNGIEKKMLPGDLISYSYDNDKIIEEKRILSPETETSWKNGSLVFNSSTLESAMRKIEYTYGINVVFEDDKIKDILITGAVPTQNLDICLQIIKKSTQVTIVNKDNKLYINKN